MTTAISSDLARAIITKVAAQLDPASHAQLLYVIPIVRLLMTIYRPMRLHTKL